MIVLAMGLGNNAKRAWAMTLQEIPRVKRPLDVAVISDLHLGMRGCRAAEVLAYLRSIDPEILVLNGDIVDVWQFKKKYFPPEHMLVVREVLDMVSSHVQRMQQPSHVRSPPRCAVQRSCSKSCRSR